MVPNQSDEDEQLLGAEATAKPSYNTSSETKQESLPIQLSTEEQRIRQLNLKLAYIREIYTGDDGISRAKVLWEGREGEDTVLVKTLFGLFPQDLIDYYHRFLVFGH